MIASLAVGPCGLVPASAQHRNRACDGKAAEPPAAPRADPHAPRGDPQGITERLAEGRIPLNAFSHHKRHGNSGKKPKTIGVMSIGVSASRKVSREIAKKLDANFLPTNSRPSKRAFDAFHLYTAGITSAIVANRRKPGASCSIGESSRLETSSAITDPASLNLWTRWQQRKCKCCY